MRQDNMPKGIELFNNIKELRLLLKHANVHLRSGNECIILTWSKCPGVTKALTEYLIELETELEGLK